MEFRFKKESGLTLQRALSLEWLETNGLGGYASSSILNCHTRRYHGFIVSKLESLPNKYVLFSKVEDTVSLDGKEYSLTANQYKNLMQDASYEFFHEFVQIYNPQFVYKIGNTILSKEILMLFGENTLLIKYKIVDGSDAIINLRPLIACRDFYALTKENSSIQKNIEPCKNGCQITPYENLPTLYFQADDFKFAEEKVWYRDFIYEIERDRGYDYEEDLFALGLVTLKVTKGTEIIFCCSLAEKKCDLKILWNQEIERRKRLYQTKIGFKDYSYKPTNKNENYQASGQIGCLLQLGLKKAALDFIEHNKNLDELKIVAGYHWFLEWGRDAMIALPGLTLFSGMNDECLAVLKTFSKFEKKGLIPNYLGESPAHHSYNTIDASLWFIWAVQQYYLKTNNLGAIKLHLWETIKNIFNGYSNGTLFDIKMRENGLIYAGSKDFNLSWMDAMIDNIPVTPRNGFQVEINSLWYNAICFMHELAVVMKDPIQSVLFPLIALVKKSFYDIFWNDSSQYLYDFVNDVEKNSAIRPNQIFAVSLPYSVLPTDLARIVVNIVKENLLTPYGLRTLAPSDKNYIGEYIGVMKVRDKAYHNGTVWPWLLGHFGEALIKVTSIENAMEILLPVLNAIQNHLFESGIGTISEIFSGDAPHNPDGCISQAWSVGEIIRLTYLLNWSCDK